MKTILEGSRAVAEIVRRIKPAVISAYPITPQTHIVEDLAKFKADGEGDYEYVRAESEFAAASIITGASATGVRVYSATSSQGLLLMTEVVYNIAGMRLPIVMTVANRAVSAPISIWNDQQDVMAVRDAGWMQFFGENNQEVVDLHLLAYKVAEQTSLPAMVNMDGYVLTHTIEPLDMPTEAQVKKYLPDYKPKSGTYLDPKNPKSFGCFATPPDYMEIRQELHEDLLASKQKIVKAAREFKTIFKRLNDPLVEGYKLVDADIVLVAAGSIIGTMRVVVDKLRKQGKKVGLLKIKTFRPFPGQEIAKALSKAKQVAVLDKSISLGQIGVLASDIRSACFGKVKAPIRSYVVGLGGRDVSEAMIEKIVKDVPRNKSEGSVFIGK